MGNDKSTPNKPTGTVPAQATNVVTKIDEAKKAGEVSKQPVQANDAGVVATANGGLVKTVSTALNSTLPHENASNEKKTVNPPLTAAPSENAEVVEERTKMDVATEIYKRMKKIKGVTRKEVLEQFMAEAKLSKAGASTYFQLIKAKNK
ncbi:hypothetical protein [Undibacterium sp. Ji49W]|uniref:hypothetical protein n=1 Tax=Undibacterium sp. Ji49W TaxID=3413040 RepID=UPI003BEFA8C3